MDEARKLNRRSVLAAGAVAAPGLLLGRALAQEGAPVVATAAGRVKGRRAGGIEAFKGIPYGAPTGGAGRFRPPRAAEPWTGVRETIELGPYSPQLAQAGKGDDRLASFYVPLVNREAAGPSEDCLRLNVWTPRSGDGGKRPVMVWCHGGGFLIRSGGSALYDGGALSQAGDVVVVTLNHRLNVFGYLDLQALGKDRFADSGCVGMLDIVLALQWVRDNISAFGGDAGCVTVFGQSGGAGKVSALLAMPAAKGLFHRAIMQSGASPRLGSPADTTRLAELVLQEAGLKPDQLDALQAMPIDRLLAAAGPAMGKSLAGKSAIGNVGFQPVAGGAALPAHPYDPAATLISADVPVMLGHTGTEMTLYQPMDAALSDQQLAANARGLLGRDPGQVIAAFRQSHPGARPTELWMLISTYAFTGVNTVEVAERKSALRRAPSYMYLWTWETPVLGLRAPHTIDMPFTFHNLDIAAAMVGPATPAMRRLEMQASGAWLAFARSGDPNHAGLPHWRPYSSADRAVMTFDDPCALKTDPWRGERLALMQA